ncbi:hypothetical protein H1C71_014942 [Ictidomys tridecemlineatus]|nr:hypothetical protein H1C71_014942 [Ictidomys tridecemlineatus]
MATPALSLCEWTLVATGSTGPQPGAGKGVGAPGNVGPRQGLRELCGTREKPKPNSRIQKVGHSESREALAAFFREGGQKDRLLPLSASGGPGPQHSASLQILPDLARPQAVLWFHVSPSESTTLGSFRVHVPSGDTDPGRAGSRRSGARRGA